MPNYLDGIAQGGALTTVADVTVSGGAVTEMSSGTIALVDGGVYMLVARVKQNGAGSQQFGWVLDSDETALYKQGRLITTQSSATGTQTDNHYGASVAISDADGETSTSIAFAVVNGTRVTMTYNTDGVNQPVSTNARYISGQFSYDSGTRPTEIGVVANTANGIDDTSSFQIVRLY